MFIPNIPGYKRKPIYNQQNVNNNQHIKIICNARTPDDAVPYQHPGWLEYWICFYKFERGDVANMVIGMIQRTKNAEFEFHS